MLFYLTFIILWNNTQSELGNASNHCTPLYPFFLLRNNLIYSIILWNLALKDNNKEVMPLYLNFSDYLSFRPLNSDADTWINAFQSHIQKFLHGLIIRFLLFNATAFLPVLVWYMIH
jgi:hypothetical protein